MDLVPKSLFRLTEYTLTENLPALNSTFVLSLSAEGGGPIQQHRYRRREAVFLGGVDEEALAVGRDIPTCHGRCGVRTATDKRYKEWFGKAGFERGRCSDID